MLDTVEASIDAIVSTRAPDHEPADGDDEGDEANEHTGESMQTLDGAVASGGITLGNLRALLSTDHNTAHMPDS